MGEIMGAIAVVPRLVVGLGNPGEKYAKTRHNVGFDVVDLLAQRWQVSWAQQGKFHGFYAEGWVVPGQKVGLLKPQTYMNRSGQSLRAVMDWYKLPLEQVLVVYDDLDLELGRLRLRLSGSAGGHNGMKSLIAHGGGQQFPRLRVGIGRRPSPADLPQDAGKDQAVVSHVLGRPSAGEREYLEQAIGRAADAVDCCLRDGVERAMNRFNGVGLAP